MRRREIIAFPIPNTPEGFCAASIWFARRLEGGRIGRRR
jgi:hypothetical protein